MRVPALLAIAALVVACAGGQERVDGSDIPDELDVETIIRLEGTPSQAQYLEDGVVTAGEREAAFFEWVDCMAREGVRVIDYTLRERGGESLQTESDLEWEREEQAMRDCRTEHYTAVSAVFSMLNRLTPVEEGEQLRLLSECMREFGFDPPEGASHADLRALDPQTFIRCGVIQGLD